MPWPDREQQPPPGSSGLRSSPIMIYAPSAGPTLAPSLSQLASDTGGGRGVVVDRAGRRRQVQLGGKKAQGRG